MVKKRGKTVNLVKEVPGVIRGISIIDYVLGIFAIIAAVFMFLGGTFIASAGMFKNLFPMFMGGLLGGVFILASIFVLAMGILYIFLAKAIKEYKMWAKIVQIVLAVFSLFSFPIGTAIGVFVLWVLLINKETRDLFK